MRTCLVLDLDLGHNGRERKSSMLETRKAMAEVTLARSAGAVGLLALRANRAAREAFPAALWEGGC